MIVTATQLGFQKLAGFFYSGLGATYTVEVNPIIGTGILKSFNVLKRPLSGMAASSIGIGGFSGTVEYTEESDVEFELEVWGHVTRVGTFTIESTPTGGRQGSGLASYEVSATELDGFVNPKTGDLILPDSSGKTILSVPFAIATTPVALPSNDATIIIGALTADLVMPAPTSGVAGYKYTFIWQQDATGGRNLTFDGVDYGSGTASTTIVKEYVHNGVDLILVGGS